MKLWNHLAAAILVLSTICQGDVNLITGSRDWHMNDGSVKRARLMRLTDDGKHAYLATSLRERTVPTPVDQLIPSERSILEDLHAGKIQLCDPKAVPMSPTVAEGEVTVDLNQTDLFDPREWQHANGNKIEARLYNLADDQVALLIGKYIHCLPPSDLSPEDHAYLESVKRGEVDRMTGLEIPLLRKGLERQPSYTVTVSPLHYRKLAETGSGFGTALDAMLKKIAEELPAGRWEFVSMEESRGSSSGAKKHEESNARPFLYEAEFALKPNAHSLARHRWPLTTSPKGWPGRSVLLYATADGTVLEPKLYRR